MYQEHTNFKNTFSKISYENFNKEFKREGKYAAHYSKIKLRDLFPVNFLSEREKFFELNGEYCPYFLYKNIVYLEPVNLHKSSEDLALEVYLIFQL